MKNRNFKIGLRQSESSKKFSEYDALSSSIAYSQIADTPKPIMFNNRKEPPICQEMKPEVKPIINFENNLLMQN